MRADGIQIEGQVGIQTKGGASNDALYKLFCVFWDGHGITLSAKLNWIRALATRRATVLWPRRLVLVALGGVCTHAFVRTEATHTSVMGRTVIAQDLLGETLLFAVFERSALCVPRAHVLAWLANRA